MLLTEQKFYEEELDLSIPQLAEASRLWHEGDIKAAAHTFAEYMKSAMKPDVYFKMPYRGRGNNWARNDESERDAADRIIQNKFISVGVPIDFGDGEVDWFANPTHNAYREWVLQFNRHNEWRCIGRAYRETGDEKYASFFARLIRSWLTTAEECPASGSGYSSTHWRTIECGIRMNVTWFYAIHSFLNSPAIDDELWVLIFMSICEHGYRLRGFGTSNNWLSMELSGLTYIGVLCPFLKKAAGWLEYALDRLASEAEIQFYPDNMHVELTTGYHGVVVDQYRFVIDICTLYGIKLPEKLEKNFRRMFSMYAQLSTPGRYTPNLNDGAIINVAGMYEKAKVYFPDDPIVKYFTTDGAEGHEPDFTTCIMPYAGMIVMRTDWSREAMWAFFESAPFGAGHQQEDKLNFLLYAYGTDMLPDPGNFRYDKSQQRQYILGTRAHNTGLVDGLDQNRRKNFKWGATEHIKSDLRVRLTEELEVAEGIYNEGYGDALIPATHKRKVIFVKKGLGGTSPFYVIIDSYSAEEEHLYETSFQLPRVPVTAEGKRIVAKYETGATLTFVSSHYPRIFIGQYAPEYMGWRSNGTPGDHEHYPAPVLSYPEKGCTANIVTVLYPAGEGMECPISGVSADSEGFSITVGEEKFAFDYHDARFETDEV